MGCATGAEAGPGVGGLDDQDPDAVLADLVVQRLGVALDGVLRRDVEGHEGLGGDPEDGRDVDDASATLGAHVRQDGLRHTDDTEDVDVQDALGLGDGVLLHGARRADARVVDQDVDAPEPVDHLCDRSGGRVVAAHVEIEVRHTGGRSESGGLAAGSDHLVTRRDEGAGRLLADSR
jgi:hypothetical protein